MPICHLCGEDGHFRHNGTAEIDIGESGTVDGKPFNSYHKPKQPANFDDDIVVLDNNANILNKNNKQYPGNKNLGSQKQANNNPNHNKSNPPIQSLSIPTTLSTKPTHNISKAPPILISR